MFSEIAPRYDLLNRLLSFGADLRWRRRAVDLALEKAPRRILDLATGTGDLALRLKERAPGAEVVGAEEESRRNKWVKLFRNPCRSPSRQNRRRFKKPRKAKKSGKSKGKKIP